MYICMMCTIYYVIIIHYNLMIVVVVLVVCHYNILVEYAQWAQARRRRRWRGKITHLVFRRVRFYTP